VVDVGQSTVKTLDVLFSAVCAVCEVARRNPEKLEIEERRVSEVSGEFQ
jgi:hypothetical protein